MKVLVIATLANPLGTNWVYGLKNIGNEVAVLDWRSTPATLEELEKWGFKNDVPVFTLDGKIYEELRQKIVTYLNGEPDILLGWWGWQVLEPLQIVHQSFPTAKVSICIDTLPNASNTISEILEAWRFRRADSWVDGYVFYSEAMRQMFEKKVPSSRGKPYLAMIEPFLKPAFANNNQSDPDIPQLHRFDDRPYVIFTGRGDRLWLKDIRAAKDAVGPFLAQLAKRGVHVFMPQEGDTKGLPNLHHYPGFSNADLFAGKFAQYISQFDAHLVIYNEYNEQIRRRVATGLSTRLAFAMTATAPVVVTNTSQFIKEYWQDKPFGFMFKKVVELVETLNDTHRLGLLRSNMTQVHTSYSFESQGERVRHFFQAL